MQTSLDIALIRWSVVCRRWHELSGNHAPVLGAFLAGWFQRDMGLEIPKELGTFQDSFRVGWKEADGQIEIANQVASRQTGRQPQKAPLQADHPEPPKDMTDIKGHALLKDAADYKKWRGENHAEVREEPVKYPCLIRAEADGSQWVSEIVLYVEDLAEMRAALQI